MNTEVLIVAKPGAFERVHKFGPQITEKIDGSYKAVINKNVECVLERIGEGVGEITNGGPTRILVETDDEPDAVLEPFKGMTIASKIGTWIRIKQCSVNISSLEQNINERQERINQILGQIRTYGHAQNLTLHMVLDDIEKVMDDLPDAFMEEQAAELRERYELNVKGFLEADGWECRRINPMDEPDMPKRIMPKEDLIEIWKEEAKLNKKDSEYWQKKAQKKPKKVKKALSEWVKRPLKLTVYSVNGEKMSTDQKWLTVKEILKRASRFDASVDPLLLEKYTLTRVSGPKEGFAYATPGRPVRIREGDKFIAVYHAKTPVA